MTRWSCSYKCGCKGFYDHTLGVVIRMVIHEILKLSHVKEKCHFPFMVEISDMRSVVNHAAVKLVRYWLGIFKKL